MNGEAFEKKVSSLSSDLRGSVSCHQAVKDSPTLPESSSTDMSLYSGQTAHSHHDYYSGQSYSQPMNPYAYHHHYNLNGMGPSGAYTAKSEYPYPQTYRQYGHYNRDAQSPPQDIGKIYACDSFYFLGKKTKPLPLRYIS